jgi:hypothetical protein
MVQMQNADNFSNFFNFHIVFSFGTGKVMRSPKDFPFAVCPAQLYYTIKIPFVNTPLPLFLHFFA